MLFYIIRDNAQKSNDEDYLSLGFENGEPILPCSSGEASVDRGNKGLTEERLRSIWGGSYDQIIQILTDKCNGLGGVSPAMIKINEAAKSIEAYNSLIAGNSQEEKKEMTQEIAQNPNLSVEFQRILAADSSIRRYLAQNPNLSVEFQKILAADSNPYVRMNLAYNPNLSVEIQKKLAEDSDSYVIGYLTLNPNLSVEAKQILDQKKTASDNYSSMSKLYKRANQYYLMAQYFSNIAH